MKHLLYGLRLTGGRRAGHIFRWALGFNPYSLHGLEPRRKIAAGRSDSVGRWSQHLLSVLRGVLAFLAVKFFF